MIICKTDIFGNKFETKELEVSESKNSYTVLSGDMLRKRIKKEELMVPDVRKTERGSVICVIYHSKDNTSEAVKLANEALLKKLSSEVDLAESRLVKAKKLLEDFKAGLLD